MNALLHSHAHHGVTGSVLSQKFLALISQTLLLRATLFIVRSTAEQLDKHCHSPGVPSTRKHRALEDTW
jgi:hypothetical protein